MKTVFLWIDLSFFSKHLVPSFFCQFHDEQKHISRDNVIISEGCIYFIMIFAVTLPLVRLRKLESKYFTRNLTQKAFSVRLSQF